LLTAHLLTQEARKGDESGASLNKDMCLPCLFAVQLLVMVLHMELSLNKDMCLPYLFAVQLLVMVPHMELGVQTALQIFKLYGGNLSQGRPGDPANMFTYFGPKGIKVSVGGIEVIVGVGGSR